jgi:hypothetical protein
LCNLSDLGNTLRQKWNRYSIDTGRRQKRKVVDIRVRNDWWDIAQDVFFCRILKEDPYPVDVDKVSEDSYKEAYEILSMAVWESDVSKASMHTVSNRMFQALFSSTDNQACRWPISCLRALCLKGF